MFINLESHKIHSPSRFPDRQISDSYPRAGVIAGPQIEELKACPMINKAGICDRSSGLSRSIFRNFKEAKLRRF